MGRKYIIEIIGGEEGDMDFSTIEPYTEPDTEQVRKEAYERGYETAKHECDDCPKQAYTDTLRMDVYQKGLSDAWEAARKIALDKEDGGLDTVAYCETFGYGKGFGTVLKTYTASEAIEKIRQYEQGKEEQIIKGDIVLIKSTPEVEILVTYADEEYVSGIALTEVDGYCEIGDQYTNIRICNVEKTGKHYDIASVLQKMKES